MENPEVTKGIEQLGKYLPERSREELEDLFAYGERMKAEGEKLKQEFWENHSREDFLKLLQGMDERMKEHREYLDKMSGLEKERFVNEYLYDKILYGGNIDNEKKYEGKTLGYDGEGGFNQWIEKVKNKFQPGIEVVLYYSLIFGDEGVAKIAREWKDSLQPGMKINFDGNNIGVEGVENLAKEWKNKLQPGMEIDLGSNNIGPEGIENLAREWKDGLQPGMIINLGSNVIGDEGVKILAKEWKNSLQPGMEIDLGSNYIGVGGIENLLKEWKDCLKPGMTIDLQYNEIGDNGAEILAKEWKNSLQPGMTIDLLYTNIGDNGLEILVKEWRYSLKPGMKINLVNKYITYKMKEKLKAWEKENQERGIKCEILV